ncbi:MAG: bifunctional nuclease family protein [Acidobacteriota bacterium]
MKVKSLMMDPVTQMPIVILRDSAGEAILPIWVGLFEANAIALQLENITTPRPMTHDLLRSILSTVAAQVERIVITDLKENTFYASLHLSLDGEPVQVDSRPSDAIALALRTDSPIFANDTVIDKAKSNELRDDPEESERLRTWLEKLDPNELGQYEN